MNRDTAIATLKTFAARLRAQGASSLYLFGSTVRNEARVDSDLDLFVDYDPEGPFSLVELVSLKQFLEHELNTAVDITTRDSLHPLLRAGIEAEAVCIYR